MESKYKYIIAPSLLIAIICSLLVISYNSINSRLNFLYDKQKTDMAILISMNKAHDIRLYALNDKKADMQILRDLLSLQRKLIENNDQKFIDLQNSIERTIKMVLEKKK